MNLYEFVAGNPVNYTDPFGLELLSLNDDLYDVHDGEINKVHEGYGDEYRKEQEKKDLEQPENSGQNPDNPFTGSNDGEVVLTAEGERKVKESLITTGDKGFAHSPSGSTLGGGFVITPEGNTISVAATVATAVGNGSVPLQAQVENNGDEDKNQGPENGPGKNNENNPTKNRVKLRKKVIEKIKENQPRNEKGEMVDPYSKEPLKENETDIGHKPGQEWWRRKKMHEARKSTRKEVIEMENNPDLYWLEEMSSNRSHKHEQKGD